MRCGGGGVCLQQYIQYICKRLEFESYCGGEDGKILFLQIGARCLSFVL